MNSVVNGPHKNDQAIWMDPVDQHTVDQRTLDDVNERINQLCERTSNKRIFDIGDIWERRIYNTGRYSAVTTVSFASCYFLYFISKGYLR